MANAGNSPKGTNSPTVSGTGSSLSPWFSNVASFIQGKQGTLVAVTLASDCTSLSLEMEKQSAVGTGSATVVTSSPGGIFQTTSGATANGYNIIRNKNGATEPVVSNVRTAKWAIGTRSKIVTTAATFNIESCCISDEATFATYVGAIQATSGTNWCISVGSAAAVDLGVAFDTTNFHTLIMIADGSNITAYIGASDGTAIVQLGTAQAQSTAPNAAGACDFLAQNLATSAAVTAQLDSVIVLAERTA
jgi:hypothetical protein